VKTASVRFLLFQVRDPDDPMRGQEIACFAEAIGVGEQRIETWDLLTQGPEAGILRHFDVLLFGGSGEYSTLGEEPWLLATLEFLRRVYEAGKPTFASCWGFQALGRAMGGAMAHDPRNAEVGTHRLFLTPQGARDPVFGQMPAEFLAQMGHRDRLVQLPPDAVLLASSRRVENQAYRFAGKPIYATQFHPELTVPRLHERLNQYPQYADPAADITVQKVLEDLTPTPESNQLLMRFLEHVFGPAWRGRSATSSDHQSGPEQK
jgi:GMP synthase (glutamine-hydrolysing)